MRLFHGLRAVKKYPSIIVYDFKKFLTDDYYTDKNDLHFMVSFALTSICMILMLLLNVINVSLFIIFIGWFGAFFFNGIREWFLGLTKRAPFDWSDVRFGGYGGLWSGITVYLVIFIVKHFFL